MPQTSPTSGSLLPAGRRWGRGAQTVLPYLNLSLQGRVLAGEAEAEAADGEPVRNPVFRQMDIVVRGVRR